jgi:peptidoglycan/LPS O-acetylase OafA/YrhL
VSRAEVLDGPPGTRPHRFLVLDGLRGIAALVIVVFHTGSSRFIPGGYLAVDLFFCLSGFVLAHAYAAAPIGLGAFVKARLIRLYPLYLVGLIIGVMVEPVGLLNTLTGLLFLPAVSEVAQVYRPYPFNVPAWSLLFELVVNLMWFPLRRAGTRGLGAGLVVAAAVAVGAIVVSGKGDIGSTGPWFFVQGMCRVIFPFFLGVLLHRAWARGRLSFKSPWWLPAVVMCGMFMLPGPRVLVDTVCVVVLVPLIVALGAAAREPAPVSRVCHLLGEASYPVYILHAALLAVIAPLVPELPNRSYFVAAATIPVVLVVAWGAVKLYDRPVRRWLSARFL